MTGERRVQKLFAVLGRLRAGTMDRRSTRPCGILFLIGQDPRLHPLLEGFRYNNGLAWDAERERLFLSDSPPDVRTVWTGPRSMRTEIFRAPVQPAVATLDRRNDTQEDPTE